MEKPQFQLVGKLLRRASLLLLVVLLSGTPSALSQSPGGCASLAIEYKSWEGSMVMYGYTNFIGTPDRYYLTKTTYHKDHLTFDQETCDTNTQTGTVTYESRTVSWWQGPGQETSTNYAKIDYDWLGVDCTQEDKNTGWPDGGACYSNYANNVEGWDQYFTNCVDDTDNTATKLSNIRTCSMYFITECWQGETNYTDATTDDNRVITDTTELSDLLDNSLLSQISTCTPQWTTGAVWNAGSCSYFTPAATNAYRSVSGTSLSLRKFEWRAVVIAPEGEQFDFPIEIWEKPDNGDARLIKTQRIKGKGTGKIQYITGGVVAPPADNGIIYLLHENGAQFVTAGCGQECNPKFVANVSSVDITVPLGRGTYGEPVGSLYLKEEFPGPAIFTPAELGVFETSPGSLAKVYDGNGLRQVRAVQVLADITTNSPTSYVISLYSSWGTFNGTIYPPNGSPFATGTIEQMNGSTNQLRLTVVADSITKTYDYVWSDADQGWTLTSEGGTRVQTRSWNTTLLICTNTIKTAGGQVVFQETTSYYNFPEPLGRTIKEHTLDPNGAALRTRYFYFENTNDAFYGELAMRIDPSGYWERYEYDTNNRTTKIIRCFKNASTNAAESLCRVTELSYVPVDSADVGATVDSTTPRTTIEKLLGQEIGRSYTIVMSNGRKEIQAQTVGASVTASDNLVTTYSNYVTGDFAGALHTVSNPNGTMMVYEYGPTNSSPRTNIVWSGEPSGTSTAIVDGTKMLTVVGDHGRVLTNEIVDIASGVTVSREIYSDFDMFDRPQTTTYLGGLSATTTYGCCGIGSTLDREGITTSYTYDLGDRLLTTSRSGVITSNIYDSAGNMLATIRIGTDSSKIVLSTNAYDLAGRLKTSADAMGNITTNVYGFDGSGQSVVTNLYPNGGTRIESYFKDGNLREVSGTAAHPIRYDYSVESEGGVQREFTLEILLSATGGTNEWSKSYVDMLGRTYKTLFPDGSSRQSIYNNLGQLQKQIDEDGITTLYGYNALGELEDTAIDMNQNGSIDLAGTDRITRTLRDYITGPDSQRTRTYVWNTDGVDSGLLISTAFKSTDGLQSWNIRFGLTNHFQTVYNGSGGRTETNTAPDGSYLVTQYQDGRATLVVRRDANNVQLSATTFGYDAHKRQNSIIDARTGTTTSTFNNADQVTSVTTPVPAPGQSALVTSNIYNNMGQIVRTILPDGGEVMQEFYLTGELWKTYGARTYRVEYTYDAHGRMKTMRTWQDYAAGQGAAVTTWNYDAQRGFLISKRYQDNLGPTYTNTFGGRLKSRLWARGVNTVYTYNNAGDLSQVDYSDSTPDVSYLYDRRGQITNVQHNGISTTSVYNDAGQLLSETYSGGTLDGLGVTNAYDSLLRRTNNSTSNAQSIYSYDAASRLNTVSDGTNSATYAYLTNSALVESITFKENANTRMVTVKSYDNLNRLTNIVSSTNGTPISSFAYQYNSAGQRTRVDRADQTYWVYQYDSLGQVISGKKYWNDGPPVAGQQFEYAFDEIGNRKTSASGGNEFGMSLRYANYMPNLLNQYSQRTVPGYIDILGAAKTNATVTVNGQMTYRKGEYFRKELAVDNSASAVWQGITNLAVLNNVTNADITVTNTGYRFVSETPETFGYDLDGNLTNDGCWIFTWNGENRLIQVESLSESPSSSKRKLEFAYDQRGRRIQKIVSLWSGLTYIAHSTNRFLYDGWNLVAELDETHGFMRSYLWGLDLSGTTQGAGGVGGLLSIRTATNGNHFVVYDVNGNVTALTSTTTGTFTAEYDYSPFGERIEVSGLVVPVIPFGFSTKYLDDETDLVYYGFRYYNPSTGRWPNRDLIDAPAFFRAYVADKSRDRIRQLAREALKPSYLFIDNRPLGRIDVHGLGQFDDWPDTVGRGSSWPPDMDAEEIAGLSSLGYKPEDFVIPSGSSVPPLSPDPTFVGEEQHFIVGSGFTRVSCCDENKTKRIFWYRKICFGAAIGFSAGGGAVITGLSGKNCRGSNYEGWFYELGGSLGPLSAGGDVGYSPFPGTEDWLVPPPGDTSGVNEIGGGLGVGLPGIVFKSTWCYYTLFSEKHIPCGCGK